MQPTPISLGDFLANSPPGSKEIIEEAFSVNPPGIYAGVPHGALITPDLVLFCNSDVCKGDRVFEFPRKPNQFTLLSGEHGTYHLQYVCRNCKETKKTYSIIAKWNGSEAGELIKVGEWPPFGPRLPSKLVTLIRNDRELFLKGRRAENQGLGIGAFSYYRRVVENQKHQIFESIIEVSKKLGGNDRVIAQLEAAKAETQFSKAVVQIKDALPSALQIKGHNPMTLLHNALSRGLHNESDEECLELARTVRLVLTDLAESISQVLRERREIEEAVSKLLQRKQND